MPGHTHKRPRSEPIRKPWTWIGLLLIVLIGIPWYLPTGMIDPIVFGLPAWAWWAVASSVLLCAYLTWIISRYWNLVEDDEEAADTEPSSRGEG